MGSWSGGRRAGIVGTLAVLSMVLLAACSVNLGGSPEVVVVTATPPQAVAVTVVTATFTPDVPPVAQATTAVPPSAPTSAVVPTQQVRVVTATFTPAPPTGTPDLVATQVAALQAAAATLTAQAPTATETDAPPTATDTALPATNTPIAPTNTPKPTSQPKANQADYGVIYGQFAGGSEGDENKYSVWIMRGDGSQASSVVGRGFEPAFSAQGRRFAYYSCWTGIRVYDLDKKTDKEIVANKFAEFASFSPDGGRLVYHQYVGNAWSGGTNLWVINADGSGKTQLPQQGVRAAWSPKGDLIAYDSCQGSACGIFVVAPNGQGMRQVTTDGGGKANWSPDGKKLIYSADVGGDPEIWVINLDGSGAKQLTNNTGNDTLPVYSPDAQYIYWLSDQNGTAWAIMAMNADGSGAKTIKTIGVPPAGNSRACGSGGGKTNTGGNPWKTS